MSGKELRRLGVAGPVVLLIAEMFGHLRLHRSLQERLGELLQQPC
jgi:hypothetical protein